MAVSNLFVCPTHCQANQFGNHGSTQVDADGGEDDLGYCRHGRVRVER